LPERVLSLYSSGPVAGDKEPDRKRVAPLGQATDERDDYFDELLSRDEWVNNILETLGPDNLTDEAIMEAVFEKIDNEPDEEADEEPAK